MKRGFSYGEFEIAVEFVILSNEYRFVVYEAVLFVLLFSMGLTFTASTTLDMDCERANSGTASALFGAAGFAVGGIGRYPFYYGSDIFRLLGVFSLFFRFGYEPDTYELMGEFQM